MKFSVNTRRADLDLPQVDLPPTEPVFSPIWIRTCQHVDGWTDVPKVARARVPAPEPLAILAGVSP